MLSCWMVCHNSTSPNMCTDFHLIEKLKNSKPDLSVLKDYRKREEEFLRRAADLEEGHVSIIGRGPEKLISRSGGVAGQVRGAFARTRAARR